MKQKHLQHLKALKIAEFKRLYPDRPEHTMGDLMSAYSRKKPANRLTAQVIDFLKLSGHHAERISNTGRYVIERGPVDRVGNRNFDKGKWIKGSGQKGTADVSSTIFGLSIKFEIKIGKDRQSSDQIEYAEQIRRAGGYYFIIRTFDEFYEYYVSLQNEINREHRSVDKNL